MDIGILKRDVKLTIDDIQNIIIEAIAKKMFGQT
jgi:hypothetical protein